MRLPFLLYNQKRNTMRSGRVFNIFLIKLVSFEWSQHDERVFDHVKSLYTEKILDHTEDNEQY